MKRIQIEQPKNPGRRRGNVSIGLSAFDLPHGIRVGVIASGTMMLVEFQYYAGQAADANITWSPEERIRLGLAPRGRIDRITIELEPDTIIDALYVWLSQAVDMLDELEDTADSDLTSMSARACAETLRRYGVEIATTTMLAMDD